MKKSVLLLFAIISTLSLYAELVPAKQGNDRGDAKAEEYRKFNEFMKTTPLGETKNYETQYISAEEAAQYEKYGIKYSVLADNKERLREAIENERKQYISIGAVALVVLLIVLGIFNSMSKSAPMLTQKSQQISLSEKYPTLIKSILSDPKTVLSVTQHNLVQLKRKSDYANANFGITELDGKVVIDWQQTSTLLGNLTQRWEFSDKLDQDLMASKISQDIQFKLDHEVDWGSVDKKIQDAVKQSDI